MIIHDRHTVSFLRLLIILELAALFFSPARPVLAQASVYTVNTITDHADGACDTVDCTLREAIIAANTHPNSTAPDAIHFNITAGCDTRTGICVIAPTSSLPAITDPLIIDGYSQSGASANTLSVGSNARLLIALHGASAPASTDGLTITTSGSTLRGLSVDAFSRYGISITGSAATGNVIQGCSIGLDVNRAGSNGNNTGLLIQDAPGNLVGGTAAGARNIISSNGWDGVVIAGTGATGNLVQVTLLALIPTAR